MLTTNGNKDEDDNMSVCSDSSNGGDNRHPKCRNPPCQNRVSEIQWLLHPEYEGVCWQCYDHENEAQLKRLVNIHDELREVRL